MMELETLCREKTISMDAALALIRDGDQVALGFCGNEPFGFAAALAGLKGRVKNVTVFSGLTLGRYEYLSDPAFRGVVDVVSPFHSASTRSGQEAGLCSYFPGDLHNLPRRWVEENPVRIFCCAATPMDRHGYFRLPLARIVEQTFLEQADIIILEVNPNLPVVFGDTALHISQVDYLLNGSTPPPVLPRARTGAAEAAIGTYVASLVHDGDTIQLGIGGIPDAVAQSFSGKKDLGIHTEMITSSMADLVREGIVTGRKKSLFPDKIIGSFILGDESLYRLVDQNPGVLLFDASYVTCPSVVARNENMVSINTALAVDLTGQVASESVGNRQYSGSGGQSDTAAGAIHARNGRSIIALRSTTAKGTLSTISAVLAPGTIVTLSRNTVDYIITEYGIAQMRGRTIPQRARSLIAIAHPDHRETLEREARQYGIL